MPVKVFCADIARVPVMAALVLSQVVRAEEPEPISDNSFLIEEAYNQEAGVVQHISTFMYVKKADSWNYTFTQEWPFHEQTHQLSYTVPLLDVPGSHAGFGDLALNYRYQALAGERLAFSPRVSLLLPTGDYKKSRGAGAAGLQLNLPLSATLSDSVVTHWNLGATFTPDAREPGGTRANTRAYNYGASVIYLASNTFNLMLEAAGAHLQFVEPGGGKSATDSLIINPGARYAFNFPSQLQIVAGLAVPFEVRAHPHTRGVFLYLSFEHPFGR
jgi:hypothetical protein